MTKYYRTTPLIPLILICIMFISCTSSLPAVDSNMAGATEESGLEALNQQAVADVAADEPVAGLDNEPDIIDESAILIRLKAEEDRPNVIGEEGTVTIQITPTVQVEQLTLRVRLAGTTTSEGSPEFTFIEPVTPFIPELPPRESFEALLENISVGEGISIPFPFSVDSVGRGYILASVESPVTEIETTTLFMLATEGTIFYSQSSFLDLDVQQLQSELGQEPGEEDPFIDAQIEALKQGGADVQLGIFLPSEADDDSSEEAADDFSDEEIDDDSSEEAADDFSDEEIDDDSSEEAADDFSDAAANDDPSAEAADNFSDEETASLENLSSNDNDSSEGPADNHSDEGAVESEPDEEEESTSERTIRVQGDVAFTDVIGNKHPVRFATIEIWDRNRIQDTLVESVQSDANGFYSATLSNIDDDPTDLQTGRDIFVVVKAERKDIVRIIDPINEKTWSISSSNNTFTDVPDTATLQIDLTASNNLLQLQNVSFEAYEAINYIVEYLAMLGESQPRLVTVVYPRHGGGDGSVYFSKRETIELGLTDIHDWDNIHHEYAHHLQNVYQIARSPGGSHGIGENLCIKHGKDHGTRLAWGEAWATAFSIIAQSELSLHRLNIPNLGDTHYTDTKPNGQNDLSYDLEAVNEFSQGEGNETAIQRILWDLYDIADDNGDQGAVFEDSELWQAVKESRPHTFAAFWDAFVADLSVSEKLSLGGILADHKVASKPLLPHEGREISPSDTLNFRWQQSLLCALDGQAKYTLKALINGIEAEIAADLTSDSASVDLTPILDNKDSDDISWFVVSKDESSSSTGAYYSNSRTIKKMVGSEEFSCDNSLVSADECRALVKIYQDTGGPEWRSDQGWLKSDNHCEWHGITCRGDSVAILNLSDNNLHGTLPQEIENLSELDILALKDNELSGPIPNSLGNLDKLRIVNLTNNKLSGAIPETVGEMESLTILGIDNNELEGEIPDALAQLENLIHLLLRNNNLSGPLPASLGDLPKLERLYLNDNVQLGGEIPENWLNLSDTLERLHLFNQNITGAIPAGFGEFKNLISLGLSNNPGLAGTLPIALGEIENLEILDIRATQICVLDNEVLKQRFEEKDGWRPSDISDIICTE